MIAFYTKKNKGKHKTQNLKNLFKKTSIISEDSVMVKLINKILRRKARKKQGGEVAGTQQ